MSVQGENSERIHFGGGSLAMWSFDVLNGGCAGLEGLFPL